MNQLREDHCETICATIPGRLLGYARKARSRQRVSITSPKAVRPLSLTALRLVGTDYGVLLAERGALIAELAKTCMSEYYT